MDLCFFQHTISVHLGVAPVVTTLEIVLCANKKGTLVDGVPRCEVFTRSCQDFRVLDDTIR